MIRGLPGRDLRDPGLAVDFLLGGLKPSHRCVRVHVLSFKASWVNLIFRIGPRVVRPHFLEGKSIHLMTTAESLAGTRKLKIPGMLGLPWLPIHRLRHLERHNHATVSGEIAAVRPDLIHAWNMGGISKSLLLRLEETGLPLVDDVSDYLNRIEAPLTATEGDLASPPADLPDWFPRVSELCSGSVAEWEVIRPMDG